MGMSFEKLTLILGFGCIIHAGISAAQHRSYVRLTEQEFVALPVDILLQSLIGLLLAGYGILQVSGEFKDIQVNADLKSKSFENFGGSLSFCMFEHRGKTLHSRY